VDSTRYSQLRDLAALVIAAVACPIAVFGGTNLGCVGKVSSECAMSAILVSPLVLLAAGVATGLVTRGWTGLLIVFVGCLLGMAAILALSFGPAGPCRWTRSPHVSRRPGSSRPVGRYGIGRAVMRLAAMWGTAPPPLSPASPQSGPRIPVAAANRGLRRGRGSRLRCRLPVAARTPVAVRRPGHLPRSPAGGHPSHGHQHRGSAHSDGRAAGTRTSTGITSPIPSRPA